MPKLGAHMSISGGVDTAFARAVEVGCETMQIFTKNSNQWRARKFKEGEVEKYHQQQEETDIAPVIAHDSYLINLATPKDDLWRKSKDAYAEELRRCEVLKIPYLVMHPGSHTGSGEEAGLTRISAALNEIHTATPDYRVLTLLEITAGQGSNLGYSFEQLAEIITRVEEKDRVAICFDTCHAFAAGYEINTEAGYAETWQRFDDILGLERLKAIHLNDAKKGLGSRVDRHEHIGKGKLGLEAFRMLVNDARFQNVPMVLETPKSKDMHEDKENLAVLRELIA